MKWLQVALFAVIVLAANVAAFTYAELRERSLCYADYQCQNNCWCQRMNPVASKICMCQWPNREPEMACRRSEFL